MTTDDLFSTGPGSPAPACRHLEVRVTPTPHLTHYAREDCVTCGKFIRWQPKPETLERAKANAAAVERLKKERLTDWERSFILSLEKLGFRLSPRQQETLDLIANKPT